MSNKKGIQMEKVEQYAFGKTYVDRGPQYYIYLSGF